jgi:hypothetical protein
MYIEARGLVRTRAQRRADVAAITRLKKAAMADAAEKAPAQKGWLPALFRAPGQPAA